jgi:hypothetical protein
MAATDPRPAVPRCRCRHALTTHRINVKRQRERCTNPRCACRMFVLAKAVAS